MKIGDTFYYAKRDTDSNAETPTFATPISETVKFMNITIMPASSRGYSEYMKFGETLFDTWTVIAKVNRFMNEFHVGDVFWVDGESPISEIEREYGVGASATAVVNSVSIQNRVLYITLKRNQSQVKQ